MDSPVHEPGLIPLITCRGKCGIQFLHTQAKGLESKEMLCSPNGRRSPERFQAILKPGSCRLPYWPAEGVRLQVPGAELGVVTNVR